MRKLVWLFLRLGFRLDVIVVVGQCDRVAHFDVGALEKQRREKEEQTHAQRHDHEHLDKRRLGRDLQYSSHTNWTDQEVQQPQHECLIGAVTRFHVHGMLQPRGEHISDQHSA